MTTCTSTAAATGLPISPSVFDPLPRRGFLRGLAALPLIGGSVTLLGAPSAVAEPVTEQLMLEYIDWLGWERRAAISELYAGSNIDQNVLRRAEHSYSLVSQASTWHRDHTFGHGPRSASFKASGRAALVLSTVGCDWREA